MRYLGCAIGGTLMGTGLALVVAAHQHAEARHVANLHSVATCWYAGGVPVVDRFGTYKVCSTRESWSARLQ